MNNLKMIAELESNCKKNMEQLCELFKAYDLAKLGYEMQEEQIKAVYNAVLAANPLHAAEDDERTGIKAGERVTSEKYIYLLGDDDFDHLLAN